MNKLSLIFISLTLLLFSGCITIFEKYKINADGSGSMEYIIDMSEMYEMMAAFSDSTEEMESFGIEGVMSEALPGLEEISGISNIELTGDPESYVAGIKFDFKNSDALNAALAVLLESGENPGTGARYVEIKGKTFTRFGQTSEEFNRDALTGGEGMDEETTKMMLEGMKYNIIVDFEKTVKKVTTEAGYTKEGSSVIVETNFSEIFDNAGILKTIIKTR